MCNKKSHYVCPAPGEDLSDEIKTALAELNKKKRDKKIDFPTYTKHIQQLFNVRPIKNEPTQQEKHFMAGFIEGEGSVNVAAKKLKTAAFGLMVDPEFSITQHVSGVSNLCAAMVIFKAGRLSHKSGSKATMVLVIDNRRTLKEKVIPFLIKNRSTFSSPVKQNRYQMFEKVLTLLEEGGHKDINIMKNKILPLWDQMRLQKGQSNQTFVDLKEAQDFVSLWENQPSEENEKSKKK